MPTPCRGHHRQLCSSQPYEFNRNAPKCHLSFVQCSPNYIVSFDRSEAIILWSFVLIKWREIIFFNLDDEEDANLVWINYQLNWETQLKIRSWTILVVILLLFMYVLRQWVFSQSFTTNFWVVSQNNSNIKVIFLLLLASISLWKSSCIQWKAHLQISTWTIFVVIIWLFMYVFRQ